MSGKGQSVGIIPINEENKVKWGCIDVDQYPLDHKKIIERVRKIKLPLIVCRSKSGGAHLFIFVDDWVPAREMQDVLNHMSAALGYGGSEVFPKQVKLFLDRGDVGNFLNLPYYDQEMGLRYAFNDDGSAWSGRLLCWVLCGREQCLLTVEEKPDEMHQRTACDALSSVFRKVDITTACLIWVYLRKAYPDSWEWRY